MSSYAKNKVCNILRRRFAGLFKVHSKEASCRIMNLASEKQVSLYLTKFQILECGKCEC